MATYSHREEIYVNFEPQDVHTVMVSRNYEPYVQIQTRADEIVKLKFASTEDLEQFINMFFDAAVKYTRDPNKYSSVAYSYDAREVTAGKVVMALDDQAAQIAAE